MEEISIKDVAKLMPLTAQWVGQMRTRWGHQHVNAQLHAAMRGERNRFYAWERGHQFGTSFDWTERGQYLCSSTLLAGAPFLAAIREPDDNVNLVLGVVSEGASHGTD